MAGIFLIIALIAAAIGSWTDIKTLEVPDWLNYSLIAAGLAGNLIYSIYYSDISYILQSLLGLAASVVLGLAMFYTGQWGGGDSKMLFGIGSLLGISYAFRIGAYVKFLANLLLFGAAYGILWVLVLSIRRRKKIIKRLKRYMKKYYKIRIAIFFAIALFLILIMASNIYLKEFFAYALLIMYGMIYLIIYVKAVEDAAMIKEISPEKLTEGDWIAEDIFAGGKYIAGPKDLGIKKSQIKDLIRLKEKGKINKIKVKYGMPFVPAFLISLAYTAFFKNIAIISLFL